MKNLAAHYRPQTFAEVAGQEMITAVLSRAAATDVVAPAYLLSGTRGVGKTTIARILAKALNCAHAPAAEPCNQCPQCRKITQGNHVDVAEIDGASHTGVDDVRALREHIGYAPMEGRYKVFIIDEAHMLSRNAFNALLKTLEEPPPRVVFILASTDAHKFPITIVSRCQHFVFKRLSEAALEAHLSVILSKEGIPFEAQGATLLARRAGGSVRDAMSLLGQTLALHPESLTAEAARAVLGLAGQEVFVRLLNALSAQDCLAVSALSTELLDQGVDIGFFLRELTHLWRTLFLLRQAGAAAVAALDMSQDEAALWQSKAPAFGLAHIHAAWHMVLEAQRSILHSPEPGAALELLLLNLALLPRLLPLEKIGDMPAQPASAPITPLPATPLPATPLPVAEAKIETKVDTQIATVPSIETVAHDLHIPSEKAPEITWERFCAQYASNGEASLPGHALRQAKGVFTDTTLTLATERTTVYDILRQHEAALVQRVSDFCARPMRLVLTPPANGPMTEVMLIEAYAQRDELKPCLEILEARIERVVPLEETTP